jgi:hypothetical protein
VGQLGEEEQMGSVYKQPEREVDDFCHNWRVASKWKGTQRGDKGELARGARGNCAMYICNCDVCARVIEPLERMLSRI